MTCSQKVSRIKSKNISAQNHHIWNEEMKHCGNKFKCVQGLEMTSLGDEG